MTVKRTKLGPGTVTIGDMDAGGIDLSCQVTAASVTHAYDDVGDALNVLCGDSVPAEQTRADGFTADLVMDLSASGFLAYLYAHDLEETAFSFTPRTADGASWAGRVQLTLPDEIGGDVGENMTGGIEWAAVGKLQFSPAAGGTEELRGRPMEPAAA